LYGIVENKSHEAKEAKEETQQGLFKRKRLSSIKAKKQ
jgi:hypothetical protein